MYDDAELGGEITQSIMGDVRDFGNGVYMAPLLANTCIVVTEDGVVLFDVGLPLFGSRIVEILRSITDLPVRYIVYGHGHADHAFGTPAILADAGERGHPRPIILAHGNVLGRFDRYRRMLTYHDNINRIQFGVITGAPVFPREYVYPDRTYAVSTAFELGGLTFELRSARGETDDATWMWIPEIKTACVSDLWVSSCPNVGNPFKVQRYALEWAEALEDIAALSPELLLPGHGPAIEGAGETADACRTVAKALRFLEDQVVSMLNEGKWPEEILQSFTWPDEFAESPYLAPVYGHPYFVVQGILRLYHGWYDGNPSNLFPASSADVAAEVLDLIGDARKVTDRAASLHAEGRTGLALHLLDLVLGAGAEPRAEALGLKAEFLESMAERERSLIARNILLGGAREVRAELESR